jgi:hypothetical protein
MILEEKTFVYQNYDLGRIMQGLDEKDLERLLQLHLHIVKVFLMFSLINAWPISFLFMYLYIFLYTIDEFV